MATIQSEDNAEFSKPSLSTPPRKSGKSTLIIRCILFGILIVGVVVLIIDLKARSSSKELHHALDEAIEASRIMTNVEVQELAGRKPVKTHQEKLGKKLYYEEYQWKGGFHTYSVYCSYQVAAEKLLNAVSINQPLD